MPPIINRPIGAHKPIALFGGSFNPIHNGHLSIARAVATRVGVESVVLLPSQSPPHKSAGSLVDARHRLAMIRLAAQDDPLFSVHKWDLNRAGPTYTIETVDHFRRELGEQTEICWIIGADSLAELHLWHRVAELVDRCRFLTAARPGSEAIDWGPLASLLSPDQLNKLKSGVLETPMVDISATEIRRRAASGASLEGLVPPDVAAYIADHGLYAGG